VTDKIDPNVIRIMKQIRETVERQWGAGFDSLGQPLQSALLAERLLITLSQQDEDVNPANIVKILNQGWTWIVDETNR
jgi:hypothetical protein